MNTVKARAGFTLVELLVVLAIVAILSAVAIPQFAEYRQRGYDSQARVDLRNGAMSEEAYYADHFEYVTDGCSDGSDYSTLLPSSCSTKTTVSWTADNAVDGAETFTGTASSAGGSGLEFTYDSAAGGFLN